MNFLPRFLMLERGKSKKSMFRFSRIWSPLNGLAFAYAKHLWNLVDFCLVEVYTHAPNTHFELCTYISGVA